VTRATGSAGFGDHRVRSRRPRASTGFRHEAIFYSGDAAFVSATSPFLRQGIEANEPALVVVSGSKIDALRDELGDEAGSVQFADMEDVGLNPVRIIALWQRFVERHALRVIPFAVSVSPFGPSAAPPRWPSASGTNAC
jgi:hypothetical protein